MCIRDRIWTFGTVFCSRDRKDLWQLYRHEKAGTCPQSLYPVCTGTRRHHVWHGIDDRPVFHCTGDRIDHHGTVGNGRRGCDRASGRDRGKDRSGRDAGIHPLVDRDAAGKPFDHSAVFYHDPYGIWKDCLLYTSKANATGMGLYLSKMLCDRLGLKIEISSKEDEYTRLIIIFPKGTVHNFSE